MRVAALVVMSVVASVVNLVITGFAQDAAYRTYEYLGSSNTRYSTVGSLIVPLAAEATMIQFIAAGLPLLVAFVARLRRWPLSVAASLVVTTELVIGAWCWVVHTLAELPFKQG